MNATSTPSPGADDSARQALVTDACRVLALAALAVLGPVLHALAAGQLVRHGARRRPGPAHFLLLHATLAGLLFSALHGLPLGQWAVGVSSLSDAACRLGRAAADALYATQSALLTAAALSLLRRPGAYFVTVLLALLWLVGPGLNFGHVHWRAAAGAGDDASAGDDAGCAAEERRAPLLLQSRVQAALAALLLPPAALLLVCCRLAAPLRPLLAVLAAVRSVSCLGQLLALQLSAGRPGLLDGTAGVLRDAGVLLEAALLLVLYRAGTAPVQEDANRPAVADPAGQPSNTVPVPWTRPKTDSGVYSHSGPC